MQLSDEKLKEIRTKLPDISPLKKCLFIEPNVVATQMRRRGRLDVAVICFQDAYNVAWEVSHALGQAHSHLAWNREERPDGPAEFEAILLGKFYADDVALRLYAAGEHTANFIANFLDIAEDDLKPHKEKNNLTSRAAIVGTYMGKQMPDHPITAAIKKLRTETNWDETMKYRNKWVHDQPSLMEGMGIIYERKPRATKREGYTDVFIGGGDAPTLKVDDLIEMVSSASQAFVEYMFDLLDILITRLEEIGITIDGEAGRITFRI